MVCGFIIISMHAVVPVGVCIRKLLRFDQCNVDSTDLTLISSNFNFGSASPLRTVHHLRSVFQYINYYKNGKSRGTA